MASAKSDARRSPIEPTSTSSAFAAQRSMVWTQFVRPPLPALIVVYVPLLLVLALARWIFLAHASDVIEPLTFDFSANLHHSLFTMLHVIGWTLALIVTLWGAWREMRDGHTPRRISSPVPRC